MKIPKLFVLTLILSGSVTLTLAGNPVKPTIHGAWQSITMQKGAEVTRILLISGDYFSWTEYGTASGEFLLTKGGRWQLADDKLVLHFEFNTADTAMVGQSESWLATMKEGQLHLHQNIAGKQITWENIDKGATTDLTGAWLMSGRERNGEISRRDTNVPRKTMKILTGTRFQWIAYNTETKQFSGTGGGTYTAKDGVYTENIKFFSRDNNRVGMSLEFKFDMRDGEWHHMGKSSAGEPMHEVWAQRDN